MNICTARSTQKVRESIDFLPNPEEAYTQMFREAFNEVQDSGSNRDFGATKAAKMYFSLSNPGPNVFAGDKVSSPKFDWSIGADMKKRCVVRNNIRQQL